MAATTVPAFLGMPYGIAAYGITGVAIAFFLVGAKLLKEFNKESQTPFSRTDARWRFYSIFGGLMFTLLVQAYGYAYFAATGFFHRLFSENRGVAQVILALGFFPLPVIWLELIYSRNWPDLGFTRYYEDNLEGIWPVSKLLESYSKFQDPKRRLSEFSGKPLSLAGPLIRRLLFFTAWLVVYIISPLSLVHLRKNWNNDAIRFTNGRWFQAGQDILVILSIGAFGLCLMGYFYPGLSFRAASFGYFFLVLVIVTLVLVFLSLIFLRKGNQPERYSFFLLLAYLGAICFDIGYPVAPADNIDHFLHAPILLAGGLAPWVLLWLLLKMIWNFLNEFMVGRRIAAEILKQGMSANLADRALHHFGNLLMSPRGALIVVREEIGNVGALTALQQEPQRLKTLLGTVENAIQALEKAQAQVDDMKRQVQFAQKDQIEWYLLSEVLDEIEKTIALERMIRLKISVARGPAGIRLRVNRDLFMNVMMNLLDNAMAALNASSRPDPRIEVSVNYTAESEFPVNIGVLDNGPGIPEKVRGHIYDAYFSTKGSGSGLGLFVVREFMNSIGGRIAEETSTEESDSGTVFYLSFPATHVRTTR